jgi:hypothetical protein
VPLTFYEEDDLVRTIADVLWDNGVYGGKYGPKAAENVAAAMGLARKVVKAVQNDFEVSPQ